MLSIAVCSFRETDKDFLEHAAHVSSKAGACVIAVLVVGEWVYVASAGDCQAVLARETGGTLTAVPVSKIHTPILYQPALCGY